MPIFLTKLLGGIGSLVGLILAQRTQRLGFMAFMMSLAGIAFVGVTAAAAAALASISQAMPGIVVTIGSWFVPSNLDNCIAARLSVEVAIMAYRWYRDSATLAALA